MGTLKNDVQVITVDEEDFPASGTACRLCGGPVDRDKMDFKITRDYRFVTAIVVLHKLPVLRCRECEREWVLRKILKANKPKIDRAFKQILRRAKTTVAA